MQVIRMMPGKKLWQTLVTHLKDSGDARWVLDDHNLPKDEHLFFLAAVIDTLIVGNLTLKKQPVTSPPSEWAGERDRHLRDASGSLIDEMFVYSFTVAPSHRRQGIGRALQEAGLQLTRAEGCYQMRSWSSLDKKGNYLLKLGMGFGFHPEIQETASGLRVSGGYFVKVV